MPDRRDPPPTRKSLDDRIRNLSKDDTRHGDPNVRSARLALAVGNIVVGRMLPSGAIKGGTSMQVRFGADARYTRDLDAARPASVDVDEYVDELADNLDEGWAGFTGLVAETEAHRPDRVPSAYVVRPFSVSAVEMIPPAGAAELFAELGLPDPGPVPVMRAEHQVAQKLHACTVVMADGTNDRARDLVDLQLLEESIDLRDTRAIAVQLFDYRRAGRWPPLVLEHHGWQGLYDEAAQGLGVLGTVAEAVEWANRLVQRIEASV